MGDKFRLPYGALGPYARFTLPALAYLDAYGLAPEDLAEVPVAQSRWASRNPRAFRPELLTLKDVLASPPIAWPFHRLECCPVNDDGGALVVTTRERAADMDLAFRPVAVLGSGESGEGPGAIVMEELTTSAPFRPGEAVDFIRSGATSPGGSLPLKPMAAAFSTRSPGCTACSPSRRPCGSCAEPHRRRSTPWRRASCWASAEWPVLRAP